MDKRFNSVKKSVVKDAEKTAITGCLTVIVALAVSLFLCPAIEMWLWNSVLVDLFPKIPVVGYWQMFAINWLCSLLFRQRSTSWKGDNK